MVFRCFDLIILAAVVCSFGYQVSSLDNISGGRIDQGVSIS